MSLPENIFRPPEAIEVGLSSELMRIAKMPRRSLADEDLAALARDLTQILKTPEGSMELRPLQGAALYEIGIHKGLFGPLRVGMGKTLCSLLAPLVAFAERPLLLVPADLTEKTSRDRVRLAVHWDMPEFLRVMTYEWLGRAQAAEALHEYRPDLIVGDEAQKMRNLQAAVTRRVRRYMNEFPETMFVAISGTLLKRSLHDFAHIVRWCLGPERMFVPRHYGDLEQWADALDERKDQERRVAPGALQVLCNEEELEIWKTDQRRAARSAFRRRMLDTPGVVATKETPIDCALTVNGVELEVPRSVEEAFRLLRSEWETPDGWPCVDGLEVFRHARELALGLFYMWWNEEGFTECLTEQKKIKARTLANTEQKILNDCAHMIGNGTDLARAVGRLRSGKPFTEDGTCLLATASPKNGTKSFSQSTTGSVTSVGRGGSFQGEVRAKGISELIMIMSQGRLEDFFAVPVTERWQRWEIILKGSPELFSIFSTAVDAARPPKYWMQARKAWARFAREILSHSRTLDSEKQVRDSYPEQPELIEWQRVQDDFKPNTIAVWLDDFALRYCAEWAERRAGIIWTEHVPFGERLGRDFGLAYYGRRGRSSTGAYIEDHPADRALVASFASNHRGKNLQAWAYNLITSCPANGLQAEQLIGRTHREGQDADEVVFDVLTLCAEHVGAFWQAVNDSEFVQQSTGSEQKLLLAGKNILTPDELYRERRGPRWEKDWAGGVDAA